MEFYPIFELFQAACPLSFRSAKEFLVCVFINLRYWHICDKVMWIYEIKTKECFKKLMQGSCY